ncbi:hypothetical protein ACIQVK_44890 [Streptomyces sp. NPDC090493]|uniref:hypothetical protein n=1 Tax=Streptomyces sp. NPDC090493 TaxID=3365964 RepID=UPI00382474AC
MSIVQQYLLDTYRARQHGEAAPPAPGAHVVRVVRVVREAREYRRFRAVVAVRSARGRVWGAVVRVACGGRSRRSPRP